MTTVLTTIEVPRPSTKPRKRRGRRGNNEGAIRERSDGRWEAIVNLGFGRRRSFYGRTREEAASKLTDALKATKDGVPIPGQVDTVGRFLSRWLTDTVRHRVRPSTYSSYKGIVETHLVPDLGGIRLAKLTPSQVQELLNQKLESGLSPRRVEYIRSVLRQALGHAYKWNLVSRNVAALTDRPRAEHREVRPLSPEHARRFLETIRGDRLEGLYVLALALGLRQGELLGLRWEDIDVEGGYVSVRRSLVRTAGEFRLSEPKSARSVRKLGPLPPAIMTTITQHRQRQLQDHRQAGDWQGWGLVFTTPTGSPLHGSDVTHAFQDHIAAAGLPHQRFHDLRHACASFLMLQGVNPRVVMQILGHSQITLTLETYSHVSSPLQGTALSGLAELLGS